MSVEEQYGRTIAGRMSALLGGRLSRRGFLQRMGIGATALGAGVFGGLAASIQSALACVYCEGHPELAPCDYYSQCEFVITDQGQPLDPKFCRCSNINKRQQALCRDYIGTSAGMCFCECIDC
ncbi:MAG: twin-arginine translocation signal domain-containing protein [Thermomicrobiales bacterium]